MSKIKLSKAQKNLITLLSSGYVVRKSPMFPYSYFWEHGAMKTINKRMADRLVDAGVLEIVELGHTSQAILTDLGRKLEI